MTLHSVQYGPSVHSSHTWHAQGRGSVRSCALSRRTPRRVAARAMHGSRGLYTGAAQQASCTRLQSDPRYGTHVLPVVRRAAREALDAVEAVEAEAVAAWQLVRVGEQLQAARAAQQLIHLAAHALSEGAPRRRARTSGVITRGLMIPRSPQLPSAPSLLYLVYSQRPLTQPSQSLA